MTFFSSNHSVLIYPNLILPGSLGQERPEHVTYMNDVIHCCNQRNLCALITKVSWTYVKTKYFEFW